MGIPGDSNGSVLANFHQPCPSHTKCVFQHQVIWKVQQYATNNTVVIINFILHATIVIQSAHKWFIVHAIVTRLNGMHGHTCTATQWIKLPWADHVTSIPTSFQVITKFQWEHVASCDVIYPYIILLWQWVGPKLHSPAIKRTSSNRRILTRLCGRLSLSSPSNSSVPQLF